jgi:hypothetical protein
MIVSILLKSGKPGDQEKHLVTKHSIEDARSYVEDNYRTWKENYKGTWEEPISEDEMRSAGLLHRPQVRIIVE